MDISDMSDNVLKSQAFMLKGRLFTFTVLHLIESNVEHIAHQLTDVVQKAPRLFDYTPIVIDCSQINSEELDLKSLIECLREHGLVPVAVQGGQAMFETLARCHGLAVLNASNAHDKVWFEKVSEPSQTIAETIKTKLLTTPVRSGQQVVSKGGDLVITAAVSHGAELLADGNIHVYGALRGRALAGIAGDKQARIFCQSLDAELVSIAGFYRLSDAIEPIAGPCQIFIQDDRIQIEPL